MTKFGEPLPCCGCIASVGDYAQLCDCRCHDVWRFIWKYVDARGNTRPVSSDAS